MSRLSIAYAETGTTHISASLFRSPLRVQAERLKLLEDSLSGVLHSNRRPDSKFPPPKDGASGSGGGKGGQATAAASEQQQQGIDNNGGVNTPGGGKSEGARVGGVASDEDVFEVLTVSDDKWISPDLPPEAGKQQQDNRAAGGGGGSSSGSSTRPGVGARGPQQMAGLQRASQVSRPTGVSLTPQQMAGLNRVSQRRVI